MTPKEYHVKKLKEIGYKEEYAETLSDKFQEQLTYDFAESYHQAKLELLGIGGVIDFLTIEEVASKYGKKVSCEVVCPEGVDWSRTELVVNASLLKQMEQGSIKNCR